ncbi:MAG TPA: protein kinase [Haliangium sp.]|nr:protein kinase [Haliangium sp.]
MDTAQFPPGEMLDDKYRIDRLISVGGMGAVYLGRHTLLKKQVAIKVLRTEFVGAVEMVERFQREAVAASAIGHPNIVSITDMGKTKGGVAFLVMEFLEGRSLQEAIEQDGPFSISDACDIACEILTGVAAAHSAGIVHRDLKPANVFMVRRSGGGESVKLLDFGIAILSDSEKPDHRLTMTGMVLGTPHYMAPEQARGDKEITEAVDIYAVGVILYEMLCKVVPYEADNYNVLIYQVLAGEYVKPSVHRPDLPPELEHVILKTLTLKPWDRYTSAEEFAEALEPFRSGHRVTPSVRIPALKRPREHKRSETATSETLAVPTADNLGQTDGGMVNGATVAAAAAEFMNAGGGRHLGDTIPGPLSPSELAVVQRSRLRIAIPALALAVLAGVAFALLSRNDGTKPAKPATKPAIAAPVTPAAPVVPALVAPVRVTPDEVTLEFSVTPVDAVITVDGQPVEGGKLTLPAGTTPVAVRIEAEGYEPYEAQVVPQRSKGIVVPLVKMATEPERGSRPGRRGDRTGDGKRPPKNDGIITDDPYK